MNKDTRHNYHKTIHRLIELTEKQGLTAVEAGELQTIKETHKWDGLSCACGGGWLVGHAGGCPEAGSDDE